jgi:hypothetical protein
MRAKSELYSKEQEDIKTELKSYIQLDEDNSITLHELIEDKETQDKIMALLPRIRKYFSVGSITSFATPDRLERPWLCIMKYLLKQDYELFNKSVKFPTSKGTVATVRYYFRPKRI